MPLSDSPRTWVIAAHPSLQEFLEAVDIGDWPTVRDGFDGCPSDSDRMFLIRVAATQDGIERWLEDRATDDPSATVLMAAWEIRRAWEFRSRAPGAELTREQHETFRQWLVSAERRLVRLVARSPDHADAWVLRIVTARGLELAASEAERRWARVAALSPDNLWAHLEMLTYWAPMWFGSADRVMRFAHESSQASAPGSALRTLPIHAHLLRWFDLGGAQAGTTYLQEATVAADIAASVREGPGHPDHVRPLGWPETENTLAMVQSLAEAEILAAHHFAIVGDLMTDYPWRLLEGEPREQFAIRRRRALKGGRR